MDEVGGFGGVVGVFDIAERFRGDRDLILVELLGSIEIGAFVGG